MPALHVVVGADCLVEQAPCRYSPYGAGHPGLVNVGQYLSEAIGGGFLLEFLEGWLDVFRWQKGQGEDLSQELVNVISFVVGSLVVD